MIDYLFKQAISILYYKIIVAENITRLYIYYIYRYYGTAESIILNYNGQFISIFWK
jgi:hypothetical protein